MTHPNQICSTNQFFFYCDSPQMANKLCQECEDQPFRYQCPRCSFRSCSLACCLAHKERLSCSGRRSRTEFSLVRDMTDQTLEQDYHFLEDVLRTVEAGKRGRAKNANNGNNSINNHSKRRRFESGETSAAPQHTLLQQQQHSIPASFIVNPNNINSQQQHHQQQTAVPPKFRRFAQRVRERYSGISLLYMPTGMKRHLDNQCRVQKNHNGKKNKNLVLAGEDIAQQEDTILWTVEWKIRSTTVQSQDASDTTTMPQPESSGKVTATRKNVIEPELTTMSDTTILQTALNRLLERRRRRGRRKNNDATNAPLATASADAGDDYVLLMKQKPHEGAATGKHAFTYYAQVTPPDCTLQTAIQDLLVATQTPIIEYPTIEVVPRTRLSEFPLRVLPVKTTTNNADGKDAHET